MVTSPRPRRRDLPPEHLPPPRRSRLRRLVGALGMLVALFTVLVLVLWVVTPGVDDAPRRTAALLAEHDAPSLDGEVPEKVAMALIATEDSRFYTHSGLDARGALRGALSLSRGGALGGATIDAQVAKLLYTKGEPGARSATKQVLLAVKLDHHYTKRELLALYLDAAYFGHGAYGLTSAARIYFGVEPDQLSWAQATLVAGLVQAPSAYDPTAHLSLARERQRHVLNRLVATDVFTEAEADRVFATDLDPAIPFEG